MERMSVICSKCQTSQWVPADLQHVIGTRENEKAKQRERQQIEQYGSIILNESEPFCCRECGKTLNTEDME